MSEQIVECRKCGKPYCYESVQEGVSATWACLSCGFTTSTSMLDNTMELRAVLQGLPKLYQQLKYKDAEGFVWVPQYRKVEGLGEVYANTVDKGVNWFWTAAKHIPMPEEEKLVNVNMDGSQRQFKADAANAVNFHQDAFFGALKYLGIV